MKLRDVVEEDLRTFFEHQRDPVAAEMAAFPSRERDAFLSHWRDNVLGGHTNTTRTIVVGEKVAGYVTCCPGPPGISDGCCLVMTE